MITEANAREVCYGRIDLAKAYAHKIPAPSGKAMYFTANWPTMKVALKRLPGKDNRIRVIDPQDNDFGTIDPRTSFGLAKVMDSRDPKFRVQARLLPRQRVQYDYPGKPCSEQYKMNIK